MIKIRNFKEIPYEELEVLNLEAKADVQNHVPDDVLCEKYLRYLHDENQLKAVFTCSITTRSFSKKTTTI